MATLSLTSPSPTHLLSPHQSHRHGRRHRHLSHARSPTFRLMISASKLPSSPPPVPPGELYQPFRPPPSPLPEKYRNMNAVDRLAVLGNRMGLWFEYAPLIPTLSQDGFTPPSIEELTGINGVEQNCLIVAAQVRDSLVSSEFDKDFLSYFDVGGAELLYELRFLNATQRVAAAMQVVERRLDPKGAQDLARAVKDFPKRRDEEGWECFKGDSPADCLAYTYFRLSREAIADSERRAALERALEAAETEEARRRIEEELEKKGEQSDGEGVDEVSGVRVPVVRLRYGEVAESTSVVVLPVCDAAEGEEGVVTAPACRPEGDFGVVTADKAWKRWVVLPGWQPVLAMGKGGGVAVAFADARALPWRTNRWEKKEPLLVVADRGRKEVVEADGFYLVSRVGGAGDAWGPLAVDRGSKLLELDVKEALGTIVLVVRPPKDEVDNQLPDEDWD
ncbi:hypothetical protein Taro_053518 [Colocasia esculenta]|uniref:Rubisco accumulation factor 1.1, chloroplastic n=1 Tax=Colocasia esculenta TaxID=4460 RepID=A0A843XME0_COLES|nr:hypothetical protein [Colocasia esculenta]